MAKYTIMKAVEPKKVKVKQRKTLEEYSRTYEAQRKYDGCCNIMFIGSDDGPTFHNESRTGEVYISLDGVAEEMAEQFGLIGDGLVFIGEAWWPGKDQFSQISGEYRRNKVSEKLMFVINDILTTEEWKLGESKVPYTYRINRIDTCYLPDRCILTDRSLPGHYGPAQEYCNTLVDMGGFDGLILRDPQAGWKRGGGTDGQLIKIKRKLSFDLRCKDIKEGEGKHAGRMGALCFDFRGVDLWVGTGYNDGARQYIWDCWQAGKPDCIKGEIGEIEAMDYSSEGSLREPRFKGWRFDKTEPDT